MVTASYALLRGETLFHPYGSQPFCANVGGHAIPELCSPTRGLSQRDTCHICTSYALLRR